LTNIDEYGNIYLELCLFVRKGVIKMEHSRNLELYRAAFLAYIDVAAKLGEVYCQLGRVKKAKDAFECGRSFGDQEEEAAMAIGDYLYVNYDMEWSKKGFYRSAEQLESQFDALAQLEDAAWKCVEESARAIWPNCDELFGYYQVGDENLTIRELLWDSPDAKTRADFYMKRLEQWDKDPEPPNELERGFVATRGMLAYYAPVKPARVD
jgi:hypothetical protein